MAPKWTTSEDDLVEELTADGYDITEIASELLYRFKILRTPKAVEFRKARLGVKSGSLSPGARAKVEQRAFVIKCISEGMNLVQIAKMLGVYCSSVERMVGRLILLGLIERTGAKSGSKYSVTKKWTSKDVPDAEVLDARSIQADS